MRDAGTEALNSLCKVNVNDGMLNVTGYISGPGDSFKVNYYPFCRQIVNFEPYLFVILWYFPCRPCSIYVSIFPHLFMCDYTSTIFRGLG